MVGRRVVVESIQGWVRSVAAIAIGLWASLPELTGLLVALMGIDIVLGLIVAIKERRLSASAAWSGITKKVVTIIIIGVTYVLNPHVTFIGVDLVQAASVFYIVPELTSIVRNAAIMGVPMFTQFAPVLDYFTAAATKGKTEGK